VNSRRQLLKQAAAFGALTALLRRRSQ